jgi:hypothetical protein
MSQKIQIRVDSEKGDIIDKQPPSTKVDLDKWLCVYQQDDFGGSA